MPAQTIMIRVRIRFAWRRRAGLLASTVRSGLAAVSHSVIPLALAWRRTFVCLRALLRSGTYSKTANSFT